MNAGKYSATPKKNAARLHLYSNICVLFFKCIFRVAGAVIIGLPPHSPCPAGCRGRTARHCKNPGALLPQTVKNTTQHGIRITCTLDTYANLNFPGLNIFVPFVSVLICTVLILSQRNIKCRIITILNLQLC